MRWNRLITSVCIFLLSLSRVFLVVIGTAVLIGTIANMIEAPLGFHLDDNYSFEGQDTRMLTVSYKGIDYESVTAKADSYFIDLAELPISKYWIIVPLFLMVSAAYFFIGLLIKLLKSIEEREFFSLDNVKRIRIIGGMIIVFSILKWLYDWLKDYFLERMLEIEGLNIVSSTFSFDFFSSSLFLGLMILLIANAFEHGLRLKEEQELTI